MWHLIFDQYNHRCEETQMAAMISENARKVPPDESRASEKHSLWVGCRRPSENRMLAVQEASSTTAERLRPP